MSQYLSFISISACLLLCILYQGKYICLYSYKIMYMYSSVLLYLGYHIDNAPCPV